MLHGMKRATQTDTAEFDRPELPSPADRPSGAGDRRPTGRAVLRLVPPTDAATDAPAPSGPGLADAFLPGSWFLEFQQDYPDGLRVAKRGLEASALVVRKYAIEADEVLAFSTYDGRNRAMTVFHFHPDFPKDRRRRYMESHHEGSGVARDVTRHVDASRGRRYAALTAGVRRARRAVAVAAHAAAVFLLAHHVNGR